MADTQRQHVVIVGGGISGLSAAYYTIQNLERAGLDWNVTVLEGGSRWGGKIITERIPWAESQFIVEGGPDTFLATKPWAVQLCRELGLEERLYGTNPQHKATYVLHRGKLQPLPDGLAMMIPSDIPSILRSRLLTFPDKARMGLDFLIPPKNRNGDESLGSFIRRRLGNAAYENLIEPLLSGIYAGDGDQLSLAATFPYLRDMELKYGSLARGARKMRQQSQRNGKPTQGSRSAFLTPETGLLEIIERLVSVLQQKNVQLRLQSRVKQIYWMDESYVISLFGGETIRASHLIVATAAFQAAELLQSIDQHLAKLLLRIPYVSTATVSLAYPSKTLPHPLDGYGYVIPRKEMRQALACTWTSTKFPHRAPQDYRLVRVFIGRAGQQFEWDEPQLVEIAKSELRQTLAIEHQPVVARVFSWEKAMPQYNLGHPQMMQEIEKILQNYSNLTLAGNAYYGIGIPDCIHSGLQAAQKIVVPDIVNRETPIWVEGR
ncbi:MAG: protoporphyrinogen oxidase [Anaerolineales bacterium]